MPTDDKPDYVRILANDRHEYFVQHLGGKPPAEDQKFDPKLQDLLQKLYDRQREEASKLVNRTEARLNPNGESREKLKLLDDGFQKQYKAFAEERQRYIHEFHDAQKLREELKQQERERSLSPDNAPKKTR
jgi:ElaB/YqjD/DUF883 family membrane-anchored ribosome-binding protein